MRRETRRSALRLVKQGQTKAKLRKIGKLLYSVSVYEKTKNKRLPRLFAGLVEEHDQAGLRSYMSKNSKSGGMRLIGKQLSDLHS